MAKDGVVEIEVDGPHNESVQFLPLARKVRGRLEFARIGSRLAMTLIPQYGPEIPGQIIGYDAERKIGYVHEPLRAEKHRELREKLEKKFACGFAVECEEFSLGTDDQQATWVFWMNRVCESGHARVVKGELPDVNAMPGTARKRMFASEPDPQERLLEAVLSTLQAQGTLLEALASKIKV